ncbi:hypothetical protein DFP94_101269 [Fontibacillus phaseoli]|uniref:Lipoprotein n=1 Tax=Fontibacillus phaseoli TaxID=1416533 RepID=A0A369BPW8_9BACL|nr:hypothetical protein [Fontibacillus phaseoli]RCX22688.1 hypothetical protein DFP94_101269 [Fontibacillus phaseoli]
MKKWIIAVMLTSLIMGCSNKGGDSEARKKEEAKPSMETQQGNNGTGAKTDTNKNANTNLNTDASTNAPAKTPGNHLEGEKHVVNPNKLSNLFGFANADGSQIIVTGQKSGLESSLLEYGNMIGEGGKTFEVRFVKWQKSSEQSNGRDTANNFANLEGYIFEVIDGKATPNETYYVVNEQDFDFESLLEITSPAQTERATNAELEAEETLMENISLMRDHDVSQIWTLADVGSERKLYLVRFENKDKDRLFSIVLFNGEDFLYRDYPAVAKDDNSVWRVDDGGEVSPDMFQLLLAAETEQGLLLGLSWWGAEGINSFFLLEDGENFEELDIEYGRYTLP